MKYIGIYWTLFAPMIKNSMTNRFGKALAEQAIKSGKAEYKRLLSRADETFKNIAESFIKFRYIPVMVIRQRTGYFLLS